MNFKSVSAVILAGGASSRMGRNKALMELGGKPMIDRIVEVLREGFREIIIVTDCPDEYSHLIDVKLTKDSIALGKKNSLLGIYSGLEVASHPYIFVIACDMPFVNLQLVHYMIEQIEGQDVVIPYIEPHYEPLYALYKRDCMEPIKEMLQRDRFKITELLKMLRVKKVLPDIIKQFDPKMKCFVNINTYQQYLDVSQAFLNLKK
ncbi:molybdenum cofactor guanylyltransferase [Alkaliphilus crotonatoxidans]